ncbi:hypothetical protein ACC690_37770, partial [Rhizobium johnstonii]|uniref:acyltransferase n=1 Tax=Rhizobium johnstonii TaxID=3019933 RepID=UPI003F968303
ICARSIILPGVDIGDECFIGSGSVLTKNVPPRSLVAGNPAKIIRSDIKIISRYGRMAREDETFSQIVTHLPNRTTWLGSPARSAGSPAR